MHMSMQCLAHLHFLVFEPKTCADMHSLTHWCLPWISVTWNIVVPTTKTTGGHTCWLYSHTLWLLSEFCCASQMSCTCWRNTRWCLQWMLMLSTLWMKQKHKACPNCKQYVHRSKLGNITIHCYFFVLARGYMCAYGVHNAVCKVAIWRLARSNISEDVSDRVWDVVNKNTQTAVSKKSSVHEQCNLIWGTLGIPLSLWKVKEATHTAEYLVSCTPLVPTVLKESILVLWAFSIPGILLKTWILGIPWVHN